MRLSPLDIRNQQFPRSFRGFSPDAVNSFCELVATELEELLRQNADYSGRIKRLEEQVEEYAKIERAINETLVVAQKSAEEARSNAKKEADLIIREAEVESERRQNEVTMRLAQLRADLSTLQGQRELFFARFKGLLTTQLSLLGTISGELQDQGFDPVARLSDAGGEGRPVEDRTDEGRTGEGRTDDGRAGAGTELQAP